MDGLLDIAEDGKDRCSHEPVLYIRCIREERHAGEHFFILPESFFTLTDKAKRSERSIMTREEKLAELVYGEAETTAGGALNSGEGEEFLIQICGWTQEEIDEALKDCEED